MATGAVIDQSPMSGPRIRIVHNRINCRKLKPRVMRPQAPERGDYLTGSFLCRVVHMVRRYWGYRAFVRFHELDDAVLVNDDVRATSPLEGFIILVVTL